MSTTIDSLQIEIQSSSTNASQGIKDLSKALGELKANGTINVAIKNLNNLRGALKLYNGVPSNASKIMSLASAMEKLKGVGSVGSIGNSLTKLATALNGLDKVNVSNIGPQIQSIVQAVEPLSSLKAGGLSSMVNALSRIGKVTADLDDDKIAAFAGRIKALNEVLEPLSTKMTTIQSGLKGLNTSARSAGSGAKKMAEDLNTASINMSSFIYIIQEAVHWIQAAVEKFASFMNEAIEWDGIAQRFGRGFGSEASEVYDWIVRLNEEMGINVQQFMQYSSIYATMLTGFGVEAKNATKMALGYTELTYDIWAGYNDVYKTFEEASEAVKSAIAGEVEPIRRAGFTIVEATLKQTAANHGLEISLETATEAQKSYLRYLTLVDQAYSQNLVGTYAKELQTAEGLMRTFSQQLKSLSQAFGSLFLPALTAVMPYLQAFVEMLISAIRWIAGLFGIVIQGVSWGSFNDGAAQATENTQNLEKALGGAGSAAKELKNATLGIDELNVISPPTGGGGGGGGGGLGDLGSAWDDLDMESLWDESIFGHIQNEVDEIKKKFESWLPVLGTIAGILAGLGLTSLIVSIGDAIAEMNVFKKAAAALTTLTIEAALVFFFADKYLESGNLLFLVAEALVTAASGYLLFKAWGPAGATLSLGISILAQLLAIKNGLADGTIDIDSPELWIQSITTMLIGAFGGLLIARKTGFFGKEGFLIGLAATATLTLSAIRLGAIESGEIDSGSVEAWILEIGSIITAGLTGKWLGAALYTKGGPMGALIGVTAGLILNLIGTISVEGEDFGDSISDWINVGITTAMTAFTAVKLWGLIGPTVTAALSGLMAYIGPAISTVLSGLGTVVAAIGGGWAAALIAAIVGVIALAIVDYDFSDIGYKIGHAIGTILKNIGKFFVNVGEIAVSIGKAIKDAFVAAFDWVVETFEIDSVGDVLNLVFNPAAWLKIIVPKMIEIGSELLPGLWQGIKDTVSNFWGNIVEFFSGFVQGIKDGLGINSPSTVFAEIGEFLIEGLWQGIKNMYNTIVSNVKTWVANLIKKVKEFFGITGTSKFSPIGKGTIEDLWDGITGMYETVVSNFSTWVSNLVTKVKEFFGSGSGGKFWSIGSDAIDNLWSGVSGAFSTLVSNFSQFVTDTIAKVKEFFGIGTAEPKFKYIGGELVQGIIDGITGKATSLWSSLSSWASGIISGVKGFFEIKSPSRKFKEIGGYLTDGLIEGLTGKVSDTWNALSEWAGGIIDKAAELFNSGAPSLKFSISPMNDATQWWTNVKKWWSEKVGAVQNFTTKPSNGASTWWSDVKKWWGEKVGAVANFKTGVSNSSKTWWSNAKKWWSEKVGSVAKFQTGLSNGSKTWWSNAKKWWKEKVGSVANFKTGVSNSSKTWWSNVKKWWGEKVGTAASFSVNVKNNASTWWSNVKKWWKQKAGTLSTKLGISVPTIKVKWDKISALGKTYKYPTGFSIKYAAQGGIFDAGSLIWAGERGAEIVANAGGGKTGVMNVQQMQDAVYEGVYAAVMAANRASGSDGSPALNIYLDGKQITATVEKRQRERGTTIMGNQVYTFG